MRVRGYSAAVFIIPAVLGVCGVTLALVLDLRLGEAMSMLFSSEKIAGGFSISGFSAYLLEALRRC